MRREPYVMATRPPLPDVAPSVMGGSRVISEEAEVGGMTQHQARRVAIRASESSMVQP